MAHLVRHRTPSGDMVTTEVAALTESTLRGAAELSVPLEVNLAFGPTWADAKG